MKRHSFTEQQRQQFVVGKNARNAAFIVTRALVDNTAAKRSHANQMGKEEMQVHSWQERERQVKHVFALSLQIFARA